MTDQAISVLQWALSGILGLLLLLFRLLWTSEKKHLLVLLEAETEALGRERDARKALETKVDGLEIRLRQDENETMDLRTRVAVQQEKVNGHAADVDDIKRKIDRIDIFIRDTARTGPGRYTSRTGEASDDRFKPPGGK